MEAAVSIQQQTLPVFVQLDTQVNYVKQVLSNNVLLLLWALISKCFNPSYDNVRGTFTMFHIYIRRKTSTSYVVTSNRRQSYYGIMRYSIHLDHGLFHFMRQLLPTSVIIS